MDKVFWQADDVTKWLETQKWQNWKTFFQENGYLVVRNLLDQGSLKQYQTIYDKMLCGAIDTTRHRMDLGSHENRKQQQTENMCQIMWPSLYVDNMVQGPLHERTRQVARIIYGDDMEFDFDMLISKSPHTDTKMPFHQDESYWLDMPDKRAISFWVATDNATVDNGCMWYVGGSHLKPLREHKKAKEGHHALYCDGSEEESTAMPLAAGSCCLHHGRTVHYSRGNSTDTQRRAYIVNYRPRDMIQWERKAEFDHGKKGIAVFQE